MKPLAQLVTLICFLLLGGQIALANWQAFSLVNGNIIIDVEIEGQSVKAVLDSGATHHIISNEFVENYGQEFKESKTVREVGIYGERELQDYRQVPIKLFGYDVTLKDVATEQLDGFDLLLGGGFFSNVIVQIDYPNSRLRLLGKDAVDMKKHANVPMKRARGSRLPAVQVEANGAKAWLILDTGNAAGILIKSSFVKDKGWLNVDSAVSRLDSKGVVDTSSVQSFRLNSLKIGPYDLENVLVATPSKDQIADIGRYASESTLGTRIKSGVQAKGLIGYDILKHFIVTIDYTAYKVNLYAPE